MKALKVISSRIDLYTLVDCGLQRLYLSVKYYFMMYCTHLDCSMLSVVLPSSL